MTQARAAVRRAAAPAAPFPSPVLPAARRAGAFS